MDLRCVLVTVSLRASILLNHPGLEAGTGLGQARTQGQCEETDLPPARMSAAGHTGSAAARGRTAVGRRAEGEVGTVKEVRSILPGSLPRLPPNQSALGL